MSAEEERCQCPDTWNCPHCVYACEWCMDARMEQYTGATGLGERRREIDKHFRFLERYGLTGDELRALIEKGRK